MRRLIDAEGLKKVIEPYRYAVCGFECVLALIDNAPTVEERRTGEFEKSELYSCGNALYHRRSVVEQQCSVCKRWSIRWVDCVPSKFCSYCGAEMKEVSE